MGKIIYLDAIAKPKGMSNNFSIQGKFIEPDRRKNNNTCPKYTYQFAENDKYLDYFSVSNWLNKRKEGRKYRTKR